MPKGNPPTPPASGGGAGPGCGGVTPCPPGHTEHPITLRAIYDNGDSNFANDPTLACVNVSNFVTSSNLPTGFDSNASGSADPDNFRIEINDPQVGSGTIPAAKVKLEAMKPNSAVGAGFTSFSPPRTLQAQCSRIEGQVDTAVNRFRSKYLRLVTDSADLNANTIQCLQTDWDPNEPAVEILDQIVRVTYEASDGTTLTQDLQVGNQVNQRRIRMALHVVRGTPGVAGSGQVTAAQAQTRVDKWFRRCYAQAEVAPTLTAAVNEVDPPRNLLVVSNNSGADATGNADNFIRFFIRDIAGVVYTVESGDTFVKIASRHEIPSFQTIYNHPKNAAYRVSRPDPDQIFVGDRIFIPAQNSRAAVVYSPSATDTPEQTGASLVARISTAPELQAQAFTNASRPGDPRGSVDVLVRTQAGGLVTLEDEVSNDTSQTIDVARVAITPFLVSSGNTAGGFSTSNIGSPEQRALVRNFRVATNQLEAFVVNTVQYDDASKNIRGRACPPKSYRPVAQRTTPPLKHSIYMAGNTMGAGDQNPFTFPHEAAHAVMDVPHANQNNQLIRSQTSGTNAIGASKRIFDSNVGFGAGLGNLNQVNRIRSHGATVLAGW